MGLIFRPKSIWGTSGQHGDVCAAFQRIYLSTRSFTWGSKCPPDGSRISTLSGDSLTCLTRELSVPVYPLTQFEPSWSLFLTVLVETLNCPICTASSSVKVRVLLQNCCLSASCGALAWTLTISSCLLTKNGNTVPQVWLTEFPSRTHHHHSKSVFCYIYWNQSIVTQFISIFLLFP